MIAQGEHKLVELLIQEGFPWFKFKRELLDAHDELSICEKFGWTLDYVRALDFGDKMKIKCILSGWGEAKAK